MFIHYGCLFYKRGYQQDKIENIYSYFKEVDYLVRNYNEPYICISNDLKILKDSMSFLYENKIKFSKNITDFLDVSGERSVDCVMSLLSESETNPLIKEIFFMHNYVERGFDAAVTQTIISSIYKNNSSFLDELSECKQLLNDTNFRINLYYLKECMLISRNRELKIIDKYGYIKREDFLQDFSKTINVLRSFSDGVINENNIIHEDLINWLNKRKPNDCFKIENLKDILEKEINYYDENNQSIPYLPKSLFRLEEKIKKISDYIEAIESLNSENKILLQMQERIAQTLVFGIETLSIDEKNVLTNDIDYLLNIYKEMKRDNYGIKPDRRSLFEKKEFGLIRLKEALSYLRMEGLSD